MSSRLCRFIHSITSLYRSYKLALVLMAKFTSFSVRFYLLCLNMDWSVLKGRFAFAQEVSFI